MHFHLTNAAYYFTTFANVNQTDSIDFTKFFDNADESSNCWTPFKYKKRLCDAKLVVSKKNTLSKKKLKPTTMRNNITKYIKELKSRQEEEPLLGEYIDKAKCEPLHLKNNTVKELFLKILNRVLTVSIFLHPLRNFQNYQKKVYLCS